MRGPGVMVTVTACQARAHILLQVGRDGHLDQSEAYDIS